MRARITGVKKVTRRLADGTVRAYYYDRASGERLEGEPGSDRFLASLAEARARRRTGTVSDLIADYLESPRWKRLAPSTKTEYARALDAIRAAWGDIKTKTIASHKVRPAVIKWHSSPKMTDRVADYRLAVFSAVLAWAKYSGVIADNPCEGVERRYSANRAEEVWTPDEISAALGAASETLGQAMRFALLTGLRQGDVRHITWNADKGSYLEWTARKTKRSRPEPVIIPIIPELRDLIDALPKRAVTMLTNSRGQPWTKEGLKSAIQRMQAKSGVTKHWHDMRGTYATKLCLLGFDDRAVAEIVGWSDSRVASIRRAYVSRGAIVREAINRMNENGTQWKTDWKTARSERG